MNQLESITYRVNDLYELVRGLDQALVYELGPIVLSQSVCLDLSGIARIDAAGLAALISLWRDAHRAGHEFSLVNPSHQVARILALIGLDRMLAKAPGLTAPPAPLADMAAA
jgi:anti-anti-sigma factor